MLTLSSAGETGGRDKAKSLVKEYYGRLPLKDHAIWDGNQLRTYLDSFPDLRRTFSQFLTPSDLIAKIIERHETGESIQCSQGVPSCETAGGSSAIDVLSETQAGTSFLQQRVVTGRIEQLQAQVRQFLSHAGRQLAENLREALRRLDSDSARSLGQKLLEWVEGDGRHADSAARRGAYLLLAEFELQEAYDADESEYETASAWRMLGLAKGEVDDNLGTDDAARLLSIEARVSYLDGDCSGAIELIAGSDHPSCIAARLAILLSERRTREAAEEIRDRSPDDSWADLAVAAHVASGQLGEAEELCNWAKSRENTTVHQRCVLALGRALFHRALAERQHGESLDPCQMSGEEVLGLRAALSALRPLIQVAQANGRIGTGLERDACELALTCAHLAGEWQSANELSQLLATARPVSLEMGRAVAWGYYEPDDELISRLRQERPDCFESLHLALVLEAGLRRATAALRASVELASNPLPESAISRVAGLVSHLVEMLSPPVQQEAVDFLAGLVGQDHDYTRLSVGGIIDSGLFAVFERVLRAWRSRSSTGGLF